MLKAPFPYFGGKRRIAEQVWRRFGRPKQYVEPFCGSAAILLARPDPPQFEIINDADGYVVNFWRAIRKAPAEVAEWADWPIHETELHARHKFLLDRHDDIHERLYNDPDYFDPRMAGYWVWGISHWIGQGWCKKLVKQRPMLADNAGVVSQRMPNVGVKLPNVVRNRGVFAIREQMPRLHHDQGVLAIREQRPKLGKPEGVKAIADRPPKVYNGRTINNLIECFTVLAERLRNVRVCCGHWKRVVSYCVTEYQGGHTAVFLDPPYSSKHRQYGLYAKDCRQVAKQAWAWAIEHGDNPHYRIALCGLEGDYTIPKGWTCRTWRSHGMGANKNGHKERVYFSPHCL